MPELRDAISYVGIIVALIAAMLLGDYLGFKIGRWRLAAILGGIFLFTVLAFTIYAGIVLT
jgi:membrane protein DedA with SNARE-associated domain